MKKHTTLKALSFAVLAAMHTAAFAEDGTQELQTVTVKASGSMYKLGEVPFRQAKSAVSLNAEQLAEEGVEKADELGRYQAGFTNQPYGSDTNTNWFKIRAADTTQSFDGMPVVSNGFFQPTIETYGIEAVEITKGADAVTYGAANAGGLINHISKRPHTEQVGKGEIKLHAGNRGQRGIAADYTGKITRDGNLRYRLVGSLRHAEGEWKGSDNDTYYFAPSLAWDITDRTKLSLLASYQKDKGTPSSNFFPIAGSLVSLDGQKVHPRTNLGDPSIDRESNQQYALGYEFSHDFGKGLTFNSNYRYTRTKNDHLGVYVWPSVDAAYNATRDAVINKGNTYAHSFDNRITWQWRNDIVNNTLVAGVDYRKQKIEGNYQSFGWPSPVTPTSVNIFAPTYGVGVNTANIPTADSNTKQLGFYLQNSTRLFKKVGINLGIRHDRARSSEDRTGQSVKANHTSYLGSIMYFAPYGLNPYFAYSESFRLPSGLSGTQKLYDPQTTEQYELGIKYLPSWLDGSVSLAAFKANDKGALVSNAGGIGNTVSGDVSKRKGVEFQAQANITENISGQFAYTYQKRTDRGSDGRDYLNTLYAKHSASLRGLYTFNSGVLNGLSLGAGIRHVGSSSIDGQWVNAAYKGLRVPSYTVYDLSARYSFAKNWNAQLNIDNIGNRKHIAACDSSYCYYGQGRNINASVSYRF